MSVKSNQELATEYVNAHSRTLFYDEGTESYWRFDGNIWKVMKARQIEDDVAAFCERNAQLNRFTQATFRDIVEQSRRKMRHLNDIDDRWLSFRDCLLNTETFETSPKPPTHEEIIKMLSGDKEHYEAKKRELEDIYIRKMATVHIDCNYADIGKCQSPMFNRYLSEACFDADRGEVNQGMVNQLQEMAGYLLSPEIATKCFILYGDGGTGKSVFLQLLRYLVSDDRCLAMGLNDLTKKDFVVHSLIGKKAIIKDEEHASSSDIAKLKSIIDGNPLDTRRLYGEPFTFRPRVKMYFGSQRFPILDGFDNSIRRRFLIVPFNNIVPKERKILWFANRMVKAGELPAIVKWALDGLKRLQANNFEFTETEQSEEAMAEFRASSSSVAEYLADNWLVDKGNATAVSVVYAAYSDWCRANGRKPVSSNRFGREATDLLGQSKLARIDGKIVRSYEASLKNWQGQSKADF